MSKTRTKIGKYFRDCRLKSQTTVQELAEYLEVSTAILSAYESGDERIPNEHIFAMSNFLGIAPDEITSLFYELAMGCDSRIHICS